ncbi:hypothetical protein WN943_021153 [Citrus x changshan-huyou]
MKKEKEDPDDDGFTAEDARISKEGLIQMFNGLTLLEELALDVGKNVRGSGSALEALKSKCVNLKVLKLGQLHGVCLESNWKQLDGVALLEMARVFVDKEFRGLESRSIVVRILALWHHAKLWSQFVIEFKSCILTPLPVAGLDECPILENIRIKMEGDTREKQLLRDDKAWGLSCLTRYPRLSKLVLDFGDTDGHNQAAPYKAADLSTWDRFVLNGIGNLILKELDYWPAKDPNASQRSLSRLAAALIGNCITLRKVFVHCTAREHFMSMLISPTPNPKKARDAQIKLDYYPPPDADDSSTEIRVGSHHRFEDAINARPTPD